MIDSYVVIGRLADGRMGMIMMPSLFIEGTTISRPELFREVGETMKTCGESMIQSVNEHIERHTNPNDGMPNDFSRN